MGRLFGTDGVRGVANVDLTPELALGLARAAAVRAKRRGARPAFLVGRDTRVSGQLLEAAVVAGLCAEGAGAIVGGVMPTPAVAYLVGSLGLDGGIVVSASHNTYEYNGLKFFGPGGDKLTEEAEAEIESLLEVGMGGGDRRSIGRVAARNGVLEAYMAGVARPMRGRLKGLRLVVDCAHGALCELAPAALSEMGAEVVAINCAPNGLNINEGGAVRPQQLGEAVQEHAADVGLAFDGDGDRIALADETGGLVDGDQALAILASDMAPRGALANGVVVGTVISNGGLEESLRSLGCRLLRTAVGDRFVAAEMQRAGAVLGGETCGHLIFARHLSSADGLYAGAHVLEIMARSGERLSSLAAVMEKRAQCSRNVKVNGSRDFEATLAWEADDAIRKAVEQARCDLGENGWLVVRASGTEPLIRVTAECEDEDKARQIVAAVAQVVEERLAGREAPVDIAA